MPTSTWHKQYTNIILNSEEGVLYYNSKIDEKALELTNNKHIQVIYFDFMKETIRNVLNTFEQVLPDKDVIGDPFWMLMNTDGKTPIEQNSVTQNKILLFNVKLPSIFHRFL